MPWLWGLAQGALEEAVLFARERQQFGHAIIHFQAIQHMLADMATNIEAARALVYATARYIDQNPRDFSKIAAMAKLFPTDMAMKVTTDAVQILGGHGYMREYPVEKMMRDAKIFQIFEGTNQILRNIIGQALHQGVRQKALRVDYWLIPPFLKGVRRDFFSPSKCRRENIRRSPSASID